jgi:hypothetical protein
MLALEQRRRILDQSLEPRELVLKFRTRLRISALLQDRDAIPRCVAVPDCTVPAALISLIANPEFGALSSCRQTTSGASLISHSSNPGSRERIPLMLKVAIFICLGFPEIAGSRSSSKMRAAATPDAARSKRRYCNARVPAWLRCGKRRQPGARE